MHASRGIPHSNSARPRATVRSPPLSHTQSTVRTYRSAAPVKHPRMRAPCGGSSLSFPPGFRPPARNRRSDNAWLRIRRRRAVPPSGTIRKPVSGTVRNPTDSPSRNSAGAPAETGDADIPGEPQSAPPSGRQQSHSGQTDTFYPA